MKLKVKKEEENLTRPRALYQEKILKDIYGISKARGIKIFTIFFTWDELLLVNEKNDVNYESK